MRVILKWSLGVKGLIFPSLAPLNHRKSKEIGRFFAVEDEERKANLLSQQTLEQGVKYVHCRMVFRIIFKSFEWLKTHSDSFSLISSSSGFSLESLS